MKTKIERQKTDIENYVSRKITQKGIDPSWGVQDIRNSPDLKYTKLLLKHIQKVEEQKFKAFASLSGVFNPQEVKLFFEFGHSNSLYLFKTYKEKRKYLRDNLDEYYPNMKRKYGIEKVTFLQKIMRLSKKRMENLEWLFDYYHYLSEYIDIELLAELLNVQNETRRNKLLKLKRKSIRN
jgi:hypothetical protein